MLLYRLPNHIRENIWTALPLRLGSTKYRSSFNCHIYRRLLRYIQHNFTESLNRRLQINHTTGNRARYIPITPFNRRYNSSVFLNFNRLKEAHFRAFFIHLFTGLGPLWKSWSTHIGNNHVRTLTACIIGWPMDAIVSFAIASVI